MPRDRKSDEERDSLQRAAAWPRCAASAAIFRGSTVLLVQRSKGALRGLWSLPGGHIEAGETARAAAVRERLGRIARVTAELYSWDRRRLASRAACERCESTTA